MSERVTAKLIGGAGTGKTHELMTILERVAESGVEAHDIGFVSFTRVARAVAAGRAAKVLGTSIDRLTRHGWFRTIHSICVNCLECNTKNLITDDQDSAKWLSESAKLEVRPTAFSDDDICPFRQDAAGVDELALKIWDLARNRLCGIAEVHAEISLYEAFVPTLEQCAKIITAYERAKYLDDRFDFSDVLGRFAGWKFLPDGEPEPCHSAGSCPDLRVWFHDEFQDASQLLFSCFKRLSEAPSVQWVYLAADPFQALFSWAGGDHRIFLDYEADKVKTMPNSWRCPKNIMEAGELALQCCSDYYDRGIAPRGGSDGTVDTVSRMSDAGHLIDPKDSWLILARTNRDANRAAYWLDKQGIPWKPTKGNGGWNRPAKNHGWWALNELANGREISGGDWARALELLPAKVAGQETLTRGTKARFAEAEHVRSAGVANVETLYTWGALPPLAHALRLGNWTPYTIDPQESQTWQSAVRAYGEEAVLTPRIRVGTIHSAKGDEADNVLLLSTVTDQVRKSSESSQDRADEEARVAYVGITRARERLIVLREPKAQRLGLEMTPLLHALGLH